MSKVETHMTEDLMERLTPIIRREGCARLLTQDDACRGKKYKVDHELVKKKMEGETCSCGRMHRVVVEKKPPLAGGEEPPKKDRAFLVVCATCDAMPYWPRFDELGVVREDD